MFKLKNIEESYWNKILMTNINKENLQDTKKELPFIPFISGRISPESFGILMDKYLSEFILFHNIFI